MKAVSLHDKQRIEAFLLQRRELNFYTLGDLDDFFWPHTTWYGLEQGGALRALLLLYSGGDPPVLLAISDDNQPHMLTLLEAARPLLPARIYAHLSPGLEPPLQAAYTLKHHGEHYKMALSDPARVEAVDVSGAALLTRADLDDLLALYQAAYPGNWFDARMLQTGQYVGVRDEGGRLVSAAGVHVYSPHYRIAAVGNVATLPATRGRGLGTKVTAALCRNLLKTVDAIGLNVLTGNDPAVRVYRKLGFEPIATYHEYMLNFRHTDT